MRKTLLSMLTISMCLMLTLSVNGQSRNLENFKQVRIASGISVQMFVSSNNKADVEMVRGDADDLITEVKNGVLFIKYRNNNNGWGRNKSKAKVDLYFKNIDALDIASGSSVKCKDEISSDDFNLDVSSGSSCSMVLNTGDLSIDVSSGSSVSVSGSAEDLDVDLSSGSSFNGDKLKASTVKIDAASGSSAKVWATDRLIADASSGSSIRYKGDPKQKDIDAPKYSGASVKPMN